MISPAYGQFPPRPGLAQGIQGRRASQGGTASQARPGLFAAGGETGVHARAGPGEITLDFNSKEKVIKRTLLSQGKHANGSEHYYDGRMPFARPGPANPAAPAYPAASRPPTAQDVPLLYPPLPHEKEAAAFETTRGTPAARRWYETRPAAPETGNLRPGFLDAMIRGLGAEPQA